MSWPRSHAGPALVRCLRPRPWSRPVSPAPSHCANGKSHLLSVGQSEAPALWVPGIILPFAAPQFLSFSASQNALERRAVYFRSAALSARPPHRMMRSWGMSPALQSCGSAGCAGDRGSGADCSAPRSRGESGRRGQRKKSLALARPPALPSPSAPGAPAGPALSACCPAAPLRTPSARASGDLGTSVQSRGMCRPVLTGHVCRSRLMTGSPLPETPPRVIPGPVSLALLPLQPPSFASSSSALQCQRPGTWLGDFLALPPSPCSAVSL